MTIRLTIYPWLTATLGGESSTPTVLEEESTEGQTVRYLLNRLAGKYPRFVEAVFDIQTQALGGEVRVVLNGRLLELVSRQPNKDTLPSFPVKDDTFTPRRGLCPLHPSMVS